MPIALSAAEASPSPDADEQHKTEEAVDHRLLLYVQHICDQETYHVCRKFIYGLPLSEDEWYQALEGISHTLEQRYEAFDVSDLADILERFYGDLTDEWDI